MVPKHVWRQPQSVKIIYQEHATFDISKNLNYPMLRYIERMPFLRYIAISSIYRKNAISSICRKNSISSIYRKNAISSTYRKIAISSIYQKIAISSIDRKLNYPWLPYIERMPFLRYIKRLPFFQYVENSKLSMVSIHQRNDILSNLIPVCDKPKGCHVLPKQAMFETLIVKQQSRTQFSSMG